MEQLWAVDSGYFYAGLVTDNHNICIESAPIIKYMKGWNSIKIQQYCKKKKWKLIQVENQLLTFS